MGGESAGCFLMLSLLGGCGKHWDVSSPAMLLVPTPLQGGLDTLEAGGHTHIIAVVRLFCSLGSFCKWIPPKKPFAEPSLPMPPRTCTHYHVPHKGLLSLTSGFSSILCPLGREQVLKQPTNTQAGLCQPTAPGKS